MREWNVTAYPWDLVDRDLDSVLSRIRGEVGATGLAVWAAVPAIHEQHVQTASPRAFRTSGGFLFEPSAKFSTAARCDLVVADWAQQADPLRRIVEACDHQGLTTRLIISAAKIGQLADRNPQLACRNAFGDVSSETLCLANPDVAALLVALIEELLSGYDVSSITVENFEWAGTTACDSMRTVLPDGSIAVQVRACCFCESCLQKAAGAGIDVQEARQIVRADFEGHGVTRGRCSVNEWDDFLNGHPSLKAFIQWGDQAFLELIERLGHVAGGRLQIVWKYTENELAPMLAHPECESVGAVYEFPKASLVPSTLPSPGRCELRIPKLWWLETSGGEVVSTCAAASGAGFTGFEVENFPAMNDEAINTLRQTIRWVRRQS